MGLLSVYLRVDLLTLFYLRVDTRVYTVKSHFECSITRVYTVKSHIVDYSISYSLYTRVQT